MKQERGAESLFFQQASEAILKQSHEEAFTFLEKGLAIARERFASQSDVVQLIAEVFGTIVLLESGFKKTVGNLSAIEVPHEPDAEVCSFCGKARSSALRVVAGPGVFICEECIRICLQVLESTKKPG